MIGILSATLRVKKNEIRNYAVDNHINILNLSYDTEEERAIAYPIEIEQICIRLMRSVT